jgi:hypothetical protein
MTDAAMKRIYVSPAVESCRVLLEGVVAATVRSLSFDGGADSIDNWTEIELGEASNPGLGQGGDVYAGSW